jgi:adenosine kinase
MASRSPLPAGGTPASLPPRIMGLGHPLLDIMSHVQQDYLERFNVPLGSCNLAAPEQLPIFEELSQRRDVEFVPGGAAMNTIRVIQWMGKGTVPTTFVGSLGDDEFGGILERTLTKAGVAPVFEYHEDKPTGTCACLIVDAERSLLANLGAAVDLSMAHVGSKAVAEEIERSTLFYCEGFYLNTVSSPQNALLVGQHCIDFDKCFTFNLSAPYLCHIFKDRWTEIMPYIDILFGSRIDAEAFCEANGWDMQDIKDIMRRIADLPKRNAGRPRIVVITGGSSETFVATREAVTSYTPLSVPPEEIVDTNGAGDSFVGGFLTYYVKGGYTLEQCVHAGHAAAAQVIRQNGCTFPEEPPKL